MKPSLERVIPETLPTCCASSRSAHTSAALALDAARCVHRAEALFSQQEESQPLCCSNPLSEVSCSISLGTAKFYACVLRCLHFWLGLQSPDRVAGK